MEKVHLDQAAWEKKVRKRRRIVLAIVLVLLLGTGCYFLINRVIIPQSHISAAERAAEKGDAAEAVRQYMLAGNHSEAVYKAAEVAFASGNEDLRESFRSVALMDTIQFGRYEQDDDPSNGPEPIEWFVIGEEEGMLLLLSSQVLDVQPYHTTFQSITWENASLRAWLNEDFLNAAFTETEQLLIPPVKQENEANTVSKVKGGNDTVDQVFCLGIRDIFTYAAADSGIPLWTTPTAYAVAQGVGVNQSTGVCSWWMRTPGTDQNNVMYCDMRGTILHVQRVDQRSCGVRPAIWILTGKK